MELNPKTTVVQSPQVAYRDIAGRTILLKAPLSTLHTLNRVGDFLWHEVEKPRTIGDLAEAVCGRFEVSREEAERDVVAFIEKLHRQGLVVLEHE